MRGNMSKMPLILFTFLEKLGIQGVKRVQALPGVWALLSKKHKQKLRRGKYKASLPELTQVTAQAQRPRVTQGGLQFLEECQQYKG